LTEVTLRPGASQTFSERWPGTDNRGNPVPPGIYHVTATIPSDQPIQPAMARVLVRGTIPEHMPLVGTLTVQPATAPLGTERTIQLAVTNLNEFDLTTTFPSSQRFDLALFDPRRIGGMGDDHMPGDDHGNGPDDDMPGDGHGDGHDDDMPGDDHGDGHDDDMPGDDHDDGHDDDMPGDGHGDGPDDSDHRGLVWQWSADRAFEPTEEVVTWAAGSTVIFEAVWPGADLDGVTAGPGVYELRGWTTGRPGTAIRPVTVVVSR
jgi:hypothetical protein